MTMTGTIRTHRELTADVDRSCDVCIVGSGAGGSVLAAGLAESGLEVVMIEAGGNHTRKDFTLQESDAMPMLYQERGLRATGTSGVLPVSTVQKKATLTVMGSIRSTCGHVVGSLPAGGSGTTTRFIKE